MRTKNGLAPIILFTYNRPHHTRKTITALQNNHLAQDSLLFIYSDAAKNQNAIDGVNAVRKYLKTIHGFKKITIIEQTKNLGLSRSIIDGVTTVVNEYGKVIVLEDDLITSPYFLQFMNDGLAFYEHEEQVVSLNGYVYPVEEKLPETFLLHDPGCWGWATWQRGWQIFESNGQKLLTKLKQQQLEKRFDYNNSYAYTRLLRKQIAGKNESWAVRWYASVFLEKKLSLNPGRNLVNNIGNDASGTHGCSQDSFTNEIAQHPILIKNIPIIENAFAHSQFEKFFRTLKYSFFSFTKYQQNFLYHLKQWIKYFTPPVAIKIYDYTQNVGIKGTYSAWSEAQKITTGYDNTIILEKITSARLKVKNGEAAFERDSVLFSDIQYSWPLLSGLLYAATKLENNINVLDFGGSLGSTYFQNQKFFSTLKHLSWNIVEQKHFVNVGKKELADQQLHFYDSITSCLAEQQPNVLILSSVLQYIEKPYELLDELLETGVQYVLIDRTTFVKSGNQRLAIQNVPKKIAKASYPIWLFDKQEFSHYFYLKNYQCLESFFEYENYSYNVSSLGFIYELNT